jgi:hypothetical protein
MKYNRGGSACAISAPQGGCTEINVEHFFAIEEFLTIDVCDEKVNFFIYPYTDKQKGLSWWSDFRLSFPKIYFTLNFSVNSATRAPNSFAVSKSPGFTSSTLASDGVCIMRPA